MPSLELINIILSLIPQKHGVEMVWLFGFWINST